jgi:glycosyltransferase involved in cell wall biosynthesis
MKMRVGIDGRELQKNRMTGIGRYLLNFLSYALSIKPEWEFIIFGNQNTNISLENPNLRKISIPEYITLWWDQVQLPYHLEKKKIDLLFSPYYKAPIYSPCKVIITIHDLIPLMSSFQQKSNPSLKRVVLKHWGKIIARKAQAIITVSENSKKDIVKMLKVPDGKIEVAPNSVEDRYQPVSDFKALERIKKKYEITKEYIFNLGNLKPHKNISGLLKAYSQLSSNLKDKYQLVIVGKKERYFNALANLAKELQLDTLFIDYVQDPDLPALLSSAEFLVFPSFYEGFGIPVLEAMACGCPVVSSNTSSMPEVLGDAALFFNPYHVEEMSLAIRKMLEDENLRNKFRQKGLERVRLFTLEKAAKKILDVFESVLA